MKLVHPKCAGLDVHKDTVVACVRIARRSPKTQVRTFSTTTEGLLELADWLDESGCTHAVMEATGVYWKPVWHVVAERVELVLVNAAHVRNVPGRKTDVKDAEWLADLLAHGLLQASFVPPTPVAELRDLTRTRKSIVEQRTRSVQRVQKVLEDANIKLASVISDVVGVSGRHMLEALIAGEEDPAVLAGLASPKIKATKAKLKKALTGFMTEHRRFMLRIHLDQVDAADAMIAKLEGQIEEALRPFQDSLELIKTMPGVGPTTASTILAEIGDDMSKFKTANHLVSWAGLCPRNDRSAGKSRSTRLKKGNRWIKGVLVQAAWAAMRVPDSVERSKYFRIRSRRGPKRAIIAVAATMLRVAYAILRDKKPYEAKTPAEVLAANRERQVRRHIKALNKLGISVQVEQAA